MPAEYWEQYRGPSKIERLKQILNILGLDSVIGFRDALLAEDLKEALKNAGEFGLNVVDAPTAPLVGITKVMAKKQLGRIAADGLRERIGKVPRLGQGKMSIVDQLARARFEDTVKPMATAKLKNTLALIDQLPQEALDSVEQINRNLKSDYSAHFAVGSKAIELGRDKLGPETFAHELGHALQTEYPHLGPTDKTNRVAGKLENALNSIPRKQLDLATLEEIARRDINSTSIYHAITPDERQAIYFADEVVNKGAPIYEGMDVIEDIMKTGADQSLFEVAKFVKEAMRARKR